MGVVAVVGVGFVGMVPPAAARSPLQKGSLTLATHPPVLNSRQPAGH